jgi:hypothetical protein
MRFLNKRLKNYSCLWNYPNIEITDVITLAFRKEKEGRIIKQK